MIRLKGMTWDHPRGYDPMVATAAAFRAKHPDVEITWERRPLQAFADHPVEELASAYDLIVIDHPHASLVAREGCLLALDGRGHDDALKVLAAETVGPSHRSYESDGHQWALAIDAATQVAAYRPDLIDKPPATWDETIALAKDGRVLVPVKPIDALMCFYTLAANRGTPCGETADRLISAEDGLYALEAVRALVEHVPSECLSMNPIEVLEKLSGSDRYCYSPLLYGYSNYARAGFRKNLVKFANIPSAGADGPCGSALGGAGIAISAMTSAPDLAVEYAYWIASAECQKSLYFDSGGQPGNAAAWRDSRVNETSNGFFRDTWDTLHLAWLRPRHVGYMAFQDGAGHIVNAFLSGKASVGATLNRLEKAYQESRANPIS